MSLLTLNYTYYLVGFISISIVFEIQFLSAKAYWCFVHKRFFRDLLSWRVPGRTRWWYACGRESQSCGCWVLFVLARLCLARIELSFVLSFFQWYFLKITFSSPTSLALNNQLSHSHRRLVENWWLSIRSFQLCLTSHLNWNNVTKICANNNKIK